MVVCSTRGDTLIPLLGSSGWPTRELRVVLQRCTRSAKGCPYSLSFSAFVRILEPYAAPLATSRAGSPQPKHSCQVAARSGGHGIPGAEPLRPRGHFADITSVLSAPRKTEGTLKMEECPSRFRKDWLASPWSGDICKLAMETVINRLKEAAIPRRHARRAIEPRRPAREYLPRAQGSGVTDPIRTPPPTNSTTPTSRRGLQHGPGSIQQASQRHRCLDDLTPPAH